MEHDGCVGRFGEGNVLDVNIDVGCTCVLMIIQYACRASGQLMKVMKGVGKR